MKTNPALILTAGIAASLALSANADIRITEWAYSAAPGEFIEFTNVGAAPIDLTGWSYDDDSRSPGTFDLSGFGVVAPGQSVVLTEASEAAFRADWALPASVVIVGGYTNNLGRNDEINLYDAGANLIDRLTYGDESFAGSIRTQNTSGNALPADLGTNNVYAWFFSEPGDVFNSTFSASGSFGNPGTYIPAPGTLAAVGLVALASSRRRR